MSALPLPLTFIGFLLNSIWYMKVPDNKLQIHILALRAALDGGPIRVFIWLSQLPHAETANAKICVMLFIMFSLIILFNTDIVMYPRFLKVRASAYSSRLNLLFFFHPPSTHIKGRRITQAHHESPSTLYPNRYPNGVDTVRYWLTFRSAKRLVFRTAWYFLILGGMYTIEFKSRHLDWSKSPEA